MSEPIKVGDLVMVTHHCCDEIRDITPPIFVVQGIDTAGMNAADPWFCIKCDTKMPLEPQAESKETMHPFSWLKRIRPLSELESTETKQEIPA